MKNALNSIDFRSYLDEMEWYKNNHRLHRKGMIEGYSRVAITFIYFLETRYLLIHNTAGDALYQGYVKSTNRLKKAFAAATRNHEEILWKHNCQSLDKDLCAKGQKRRLKDNKGPGYYERQKRRRGLKAYFRLRKAVKGQQHLLRGRGTSDSSQGTRRTEQGPRTAGTRHNTDAEPCRNAVCGFL